MIRAQPTREFCKRHCFHFFFFLYPSGLLVQFIRFKFAHVILAPPGVYRDRIAAIQREDLTYWPRPLCPTELGETRSKQGSDQNTHVGGSRSASQSIDRPSLLSFHQVEILGPLLLFVDAKGLKADRCTNLLRASL